MQRLFSTFPNGWPGFGLLLLRFCLGIALISFGIAALSAQSSEVVTLIQSAVETVGGAFLLAGLWTPIMASLAAVDEIWIVFSPNPSGPDRAWIHVFLGVLAVSIAMLGPGAWSIDARLFGRKRFDIDRTRK